MTIGEIIRERREALGLAETALAVRVGVTDETIHSWETGQTKPHGRYISALCATLGVSEDWLESKAVVINAADAEECLLYDHTAPPMEICWYADCAHCGWHSQEHARREALLREQGLTRLDNGLKGLKIGGADCWGDKNGG